MRARVLLLMPTTTYRSEDFVEAVQRLDVEFVVGTDRLQALEQTMPGYTLWLDFTQPERSVGKILEMHRTRPFDAVLGVDDETTLLAAHAGEAIGIPHNPVEAVRASRSKYETRRRTSEAGMRSPRFRRVGLDASPEVVAGEIDYPCVLKPLGLSAGRGVLRADTPGAFVEAFERIAAILKDGDVAAKAGDTEHLLVEDYIHGGEVSVEGLLERGRFRALALFDKPDPLHGPTFEETLFVTPSRHPESVQRAIVDEAARGCEALGLVDGPVHAELRVKDGAPWLLEVAARTIGGLCSRTLRFGAGVSLEELILHHALGLGTSEMVRQGHAAGVMMIPVPEAGILRGVLGLDEARAVPRVEDVTLTMHRGSRLVPWPEGHRYLGFIFARGTEPDEVERALRKAHDRLSFTVEAG